MSLRPFSSLPDGVVDVLQTWSLQKRLERMVKVNMLKEDGDGISAMEPHRYCMRFQHKMKDILGIRGDASQHHEHRVEVS